MLDEVERERERERERESAKNEGEDNDEFSAYRYIELAGEGEVAAPQTSAS